MLRERQAIVKYGKKMATAGLTVGTAGNLSVRGKDGVIAISPSGMEYDCLSPRDVSLVDINGNLLPGSRKPSSELPMHIAIYRNRDDLHALVHTHSRCATAVSCLGIDLPAVHYAIGFAGSAVRCVPYATYGTAELAQKVVSFLRQDKAVLLENHGVIVGGATLEEAFMLAELIEFCAELYVLARSIGTPHIIPAREMQRIRKKLSDYGQK